MLKIRLKPVGRKGKILYKVAVMKNLSLRTGKSVKDIGFYDPYKKIFLINEQKLLNYLENGAYPTNTVRHLIQKYISQIKSKTV